MIVDRAERLSPLVTPWIEALLAHERAIVPQTAGMRARAFDRARALVAAGPKASLPPALGSGWARIMFGSAAGFGVLTAVAIAHMASSRLPSASAISLPLDPTSALIEPSAARAKSPSPTILPPSPTPDEEAAEDAAAARALSSDPQTGQAQASPPTLDELGMLERAQKSDARGDFSAVLALAAQHEHLYPTGRLSEEREVLRLRALIGLGRGPEAQRAVRKFRRDYPHSVLLPTLDQMLAATR